MKTHIYKEGIVMRVSAYTHNVCMKESQRERNTSGRKLLVVTVGTHEKKCMQGKQEREKQSFFFLFSFRLRTNSIASLILIFPLYKMSHRTISLFSSPVRFIILERVSGISRHSRTR